MELSAAYPGPGVRWWRTAGLDRARGRVTVTDSWDLGPGDGPVRLHWLIAGEVTVGEGRATVVSPYGAGVLILTWDPAGAPATTTVRERDDPMHTGVWGDRLTRLEIDVTALGPVGRLELDVEEQR
jgi:hypothetical protein